MSETPGGGGEWEETKDYGITTHDIYAFTAFFQVPNQNEQRRVDFMADTWNTATSQISVNYLHSVSWHKIQTIWRASVNTIGYR